MGQLHFTAFDLTAISPIKAFWGSDIKITKTMFPIPFLKTDLNLSSHSNRGFGFIDVNFNAVTLKGNGSECR